MAGNIHRSIAMGVKDPAINGRFLVIFPFLGDTFKLLAESVTETFTRITPNQRFYGGRFYAFPGVAEQEIVHIIFYETHDFYVTKLINEWRLMVVDENDNYGLPSDYMRDFRVEHYGLENSTSPVLVTQYERAWPSERMPFELNYTEIDGRLAVGVDMAVARSTLE